MPKFELGPTVDTRALRSRRLRDPAFGLFCLKSLGRHRQGDWGDLSEEDKKENEFSLERHLRLFSAYTHSDGTKIWIITEADRSVTTTLFPSDY